MALAPEVIAALNQLPPIEDKRNTITGPSQTVASPVVTKGRIVFVTDGHGERAAVVAHVLENNRINASILDVDGTTFPACNIRHENEPALNALDGAYWQWPSRG